ncbi:hypothetical protein CCHR01_19327 [Colletotrichum chrysophilum]|uniref:Uncharacterized protein n=1 Tax=Colletotrichum chrysophilum TaxID=1836956 RepID=A0AAD9E7A7_9PEZI|nr:hypothetical protein K456DRAFT_1475438 [Colletotrichum gloeosporioides 23]KAK1838050.1 hypothetical protein CCHR01_19327 [Colletotrichum chrysophilum]
MSLRHPTPGSTPSRLVLPGNTREALIIATYLPACLPALPTHGARTEARQGKGTESIAVSGTTTLATNRPPTTRSVRGRGSRHSAVSDLGLDRNSPSGFPRPALCRARAGGGINSIHLNWPILHTRAWDTWATQTTTKIGLC